MPSSSDAETASAGFVELVRSRDTPLESRFVFLAVFCIVIVGTASLLTVRRSGVQAFELPEALTNLATQLSNARDEIQLLQDIDLLAPNPDRAALIEAELTPFEQPDILEPEPGCLVFDRDPYLVRFQQLSPGTSDWGIFWLDEREATEIDHALHIAGDGESLCEDHGEWLRYEVNPK
ncbi:MAG: hypothetical protein AAGI88_04160 [Pseudomonadota bacterium]